MDQKLHGSEAERLFSGRFAALPTDCGQVCEPGTDEVEAWRDWTDRPTTEDQVRIENVLADLVRPGSRILHVGVGNSGLARRFARPGRTIIGTTISTAELAHGNSLNLPGYAVHALNEYGDTPPPGPAEFDFIVDNNPTAFGCCRTHLLQMLDHYQSRLARDGLILTDRKGLGWVTSAPGANPRWAFSVEDWAQVGRLFGLRIEQLSDTVVALAPPGGRVVRRPLLRRLATRLRQRLAG